MANVELRAVRKAYGSASVIHGVSVDIDQSEFVILVGPSGCGKSTLLRMIAGLENITEGEIRIGGRLVNNVAPKERDIAMVFQNYALYPHMTVSENMAFSLKLKKAPREEREARVKRAAEILSLTKSSRPLPAAAIRRPATACCHGSRNRAGPAGISFRRAIVEPRCKLRVQMRAEIKELHQRLKTTTVYVTHDQVEAMTMADKIVVMHDGVVEQVGAPLELYDNPANMLLPALSARLR